MAAPSLCLQLPGQQRAPDYHLLLKLLRHARLQDLCDVVVIVGETRFRTFRAILAAASDVLRCLVARNTGGEIRIKYLSAPIFESVLNFIFTGELNATSESILDLYVAAEYLLINQLKEHLRPVVLKYMTAANVFDFGELAFRFDDDDLQVSCDNFIVHNFDLVARSDCFLQQPFSCVEHFVSCHDLDVETEDSVLRAVVRWVLFDPAERVGSQQAALLTHVCASKFSLAELHTILKSLGSETAFGQRIADEILSRQQRTQLQETSSRNVRIDADGDHEVPVEDTPESRGHLEADEPEAEVDLFRRTPSRAIREVDVDGNVRPRFRMPQQCVRSISFDYVLRNVSQFNESSQSSPWYRCGGGLMWRLETYAVSSGEYLSCFLRCSDESETSQFRALANFTLSIISQTTGVQAKVFEATKQFTNDAPCWGKTRWLGATDILDSTHGLRDWRTDAMVIAATVVW
jgi:BTB/POZ domain/BTB And C-terminal Kelch/MATH domain